MPPWRMHSRTYQVLLAFRAIIFRYPSDRLPHVPTFNGRDVAVDDHEPRNEVLEALYEVLDVPRLFQ